MQLTAPFRRLSPSALAGLVLLLSFFCCSSVQARQARGVPQPRPAAPVRQPPAPRAAVGPKQNQEHLAGWMDRHRNLSLAEQQTALQNEPGFKQYPPETQQRLLNRLAQLNKMPEEQRRRLLERNEVIENLTPAQRQQVRSATQQFNSLPPDRRRLLARAFRDLREMPEPQRQAILTSDRLHGEFSDYERSTLTNLLAIEPYLPVKSGNDPVNAGK